MSDEKPITHDLPELVQIIREATQQVEDELEIEDRGWIRGTTSSQIITELARSEAVKLSRLYYTKDPLAKQAIRLWTDYTFGSGMTWQCDDEAAKKALEGYWGLKGNQSVLSAKGQRKCSDKLLVEGEVFFALFLGREVRVRLIDPLEVTEIITDPDDKDDERYYKREWSDVQSKAHTDYYCSHENPKDKSCKDWAGKNVTATPNARNVLVYHLSYNTIGQRGMPLLLPALEWIKQYRRFLASRVAIMLALARFAWKAKVQGGTAAVAVAKGVLNETVVPAGSVMVENQGSDLQPIRTDSNARGAYDDGRMLKLQVCAAVGIPEQYFGDIATGNLATAKTVELPLMKMFQSYQAIWSDAFKDMDEIVLEHGGINEKAWYVDRDFAAIAPEDVAQVAQSLGLVLQNLPQLADSPDVQQVALMALGINDPAEVLDALAKESGGNKHNSNVALLRALKRLEEAIRTGGNVHALS